MATWVDSCLGPEAIERLVSGGELRDDVVRHAESCDSCRAKLQLARDESEFLTKVRKLTSLGPEGAPRVPGYQTLEVLSAGAQGVVFRAIQESTSRTVAIKVLTAGQTGSARQRLRAEREAEIAARLRHPNIVTIFESRPLQDGRIAVVMEFVDGVPLDAWEAGGQHADERLVRVLRVFVDICGAIHHAHLNGVIHRDIKPDNVMVTAEGRPVVLDFGIAKAGGIQATITGEFAGTPAYASPEQVLGRPDDVDALTDVYSLGVILYRLVCGGLPYEVSGSIFEIARTIGEVEPELPRRKVPSLSPDLEAVILRALRKNKAHRYQSSAALAQDIERYLSGEPVEARSGSGWYVLRKAIALNRRSLAWAGAGVLVLLGAGVSVSMSLSRAAEEERRANFEQEQARAENVRARAVTELLREALPNADPGNPELGLLISAGFGRLYFRLETGAFGDDPALDQALRRMWGEIYTGLGSGKALSLVEYSEVSLRHGLVRLRQEHGKEHPEIAATLHQLAGVLLVRKRAPEAEGFCREAIAMRENLLGAGSQTTAESRALLAKILLADGRQGAAVQEADRALAVFRNIDTPDVDLPIASMLALKSRVLFNSGSTQDCEPLLTEALTRRVRRLPPEDPELLGTLSDAVEYAEQSPDSQISRILCKSWGATGSAALQAIRSDIPIISGPDRSAFQPGSIPGRAEALGRLLNLERELLGENDPSQVLTLIAQLQAAVTERKSDIRIDAALRAAKILRAKHGEGHPAVLVCLVEAAGTHAYYGNPSEAAALQRQVCDALEKLAPEARDTLGYANARRTLAWFLTMQGDYSEAASQYERAMKDLRTVVSENHHVMALSKAGLAVCLAHLGSLDDALELSDSAMRDLDASPAAHIDQIAHAHFVRGHVLALEAARCAQRGEPQRAREVARSAVRPLEDAWANMYQVCPPIFTWRRLLIADRVALSEVMADTNGAGRWRAWIDRAWVGGANTPQDVADPAQGPP